MKREKMIDGKWMHGWKDEWAYFQLNLNCMRLGRGTIEPTDMYVPTDTYMHLILEHKDFLRTRGWWHHLKQGYKRIENEVGKRSIINKIN